MGRGGWLGPGGPAQDLTRRNATISRKNSWKDNLARCDQLLGGLALATGDTVTAGRHLATAVAVFRDGDYLTDVAETLPGLAECAQVTGDLDAAERYLAEAITIAAPRALVPAHAAALAAPGPAARRPGHRNREHRRAAAGPRRR